VWIRRPLGLRGVRRGKGGRRDSIQCFVTLAFMNAQHNLDHRGRSIQLCESLSGVICRNAYMIDWYDSTIEFGFRFLVDIGLVSILRHC